MRPPRAAFLNFPLGNQVGPPNDPAVQREIVLRTLDLLESIDTPGEILHLPFEWGEPDWQREVLETYRQDAATVMRQRVESEFDGEWNFALQECVDVCSLV